MKPYVYHLPGRIAVNAVLLMFCALLIGTVAATVSQADMRRDTLKLITATGQYDFDIEIANTSEEKARGLMFRRSLGERAGMLFPYEPPQEATMWMRNTYIPLDMVFIRADGVVHRIEANTEPFSERIIESRGDVAAVLELKAGTAAKIGLKPGDHVRQSMFKPAGH
jgi:uncharacterized membrane protein (UPF0127 family)